MAVAQKLDVYRDMYSLLMTIEDLRVHFPKMYKYDFGNKLFMTGLECCELIQAANMTQGVTRLDYINMFIVKFGTLKLLLRVCSERHIITRDQSADIIVRLDGIGKQMSGWKNHTMSLNPEFRPSR